MAQRLIRMIPPPVTSGCNPITVNGRVYSSPSLAPIDMVDFDAAVAGFNGWTPLGIVGTTAQRPTAQDTDMAAEGIPPGLRYIDTTLNASILFDASSKVWRHAVTGAVV